MKKVRKIHFWIGVIVSLFLLIESISGIYLYFQEHGRRGSEFPPQGRMQQQTDSNANNDNSMANQNNIPAIPNGGQNNGIDRSKMINGSESGANSFGMTMREMHNGIVGLIAGIGMLLLTITGLALSWIIGRNTRMKKKRIRNDNVITQ